MGVTSFISFNLAFFCLLVVNVYGGDNSNRKEMLEISIGIGGGGGGGGSDCGCISPTPPPPPPSECPPPLPPPPPPPSPPGPLDFLDARLYEAYRVIQRLKAQVTDDPNGITKTWQGTDICGKYKGFYCESPPDNKSAITVASVDFNSFNIAFQSLEEIGNLHDLAIFHANTNRFKGTIPLSFTKSPYLYEVDVSNNLLSGTFPSIVLAMSNLAFLDLRFNNFVGTVPRELFLKDLQVLFINDNLFTQQIPDNLGKSPVNYLTLANNRFSGGIPKSIRNMSKTLIEVLFLNNLISGCLPYEIGFLKETTVFDSGRNQLSGPIPLSFGCLDKIERLNLAGNYLYGKIPDIVCALSSLVNLSLSDNYFNFEGSVCRDLASKGVLDDRKNCIPGRPNQRSTAECTAFYSKPLCQCGNPFYYSCIPCKHPGFSSKTTTPIPPSPF